jgi:hypothetical protein
MVAGVRRILWIVLAALAVAGCTKSSDNGAGANGAPARTHKNAYTQPHVLRIGDTQDFNTLNPHLATALILNDLSQLTMAYLVRYGKNNQPVPELATSVPTQANGGVSKDGKTITWHLRRGVKWSDGAPFDGDDVVFSANAVNNMANNEVGRDGWELITTRARVQHRSHRLASQQRDALRRLPERRHLVRVRSLRTEPRSRSALRRAQGGSAYRRSTGRARRMIAMPSTMQPAKGIARRAPQAGTSASSPAACCSAAQTALASAFAGA